MLNHLSLCSGIGGLDLAAEWAGFRTVAQCEIDEYASKVLAKNFKGVPNLHDIRTVTNGRLAEYGIRVDEITVISAGFPCQPYSLAGKGKGDRDERDLWGEVARVLGELRPRWFVGENTPGLFARENQRYFRRIISDLAALGYSVGWGIWGACNVGAPHKRDRVFLMAHADGERRRVFGANGRETCRALGESEAKTPFRTGSIHRNARGGVFYLGDVRDAHGERRKADEFDKQYVGGALYEEGRENEPCGANRGADAISDADGVREQQPCGEQQESGKRACDVREIISDARSEREDERWIGSAREVERNGYGGDDHGRRAAKYVGGEWWEVEPDVGRVAHGVSDRVDKLRCLGNAVVPYQAYPIFEAIAEFEMTVTQ